MAQSTIKVAVTGNAPFLNYDINTSELVKNALPELIERDGKPTILILKYNRATVDSYDDIRQVSKDVWGGQRSFFQRSVQGNSDDGPIPISFILHLGMEIRKEEYCFETTAHCDGYHKPGKDGKFIGPQHFEDREPPPVLKSKFNIKKAWERIAEKFPDVESRVSDDAGSYFCEFRLYSSLLEVETNNPTKAGKVAFMHIPQRHDEEAIKLATDIAKTFIEALADDEAMG